MVCGEREPGVGEEVLQSAARLPADRPGGAPSRSACGVAVAVSVSSRPRRLIISEVQPTQWRAAACAAKSSSQADGSASGRPDARPARRAGPDLAASSCAQSVRDDDRQLPAGPAGAGRLGPAVAAAAPVWIPGPDHLAAIGACPGAGGAPAGPGSSSRRLPQAGQGAASPCWRQRGHQAPCLRSGVPQPAQ